MPVRRIALLPSIALLLVSTGCVQLLGTFERDPGGAGGTGGGGAGGAGGAAGAGGSAGAAGAGGAKQASGPCGYGCDGLDADCDGDAGNGFEADLRTDPANCGGCGVACATGTCSDGACTVLTVWTGAEQPRELKLDETLVYFLLDGSVIGMTKDGVAQSSYAIAESAPQSLAQDGDHLYWVSKGSSEIRKVAKTGGMVSTVLTEPFVDRVAVDGPTLFWTTTGDPGAPVPYADGAVRSAALDGSGQAPVASGQQHPLGLAAGDGNLLWSTGDPVDPCLGQVNLLSPGAQSPEVFASLYASSLELAAGTVVSVDACTNQFTAQPLAGGPAGAQGGLPYAIEGSVLYGVFYGAGLASPVWALPSAQTVVDVVDTATTAGVVELGVDQTSLFYSSQDELGNHVIRRVEKPWSLRPHGSCPYGRADCNDDPMDGCEVSLWTDPQNCGGCGRSCGSAACDTHCVPNVAYQAASPLLGGVADASYLYVSELNGITRVPHGGGPAEPLTQSVSPSAGIAVDATHAYFANLGTQIVKVSLQDSSTSVLGAAPGAVAVVVDGGDVFWAGGTSVAKLPAAGGPGTTLASQQVSPGGDGLSGLLVVGDDVFWTTGLDAPDAAILRVSRNGGPVSTIASGLQGPLTIATDGTHLFWSESDQGIYRANLDGTEARQISWSSPFVRGLVDDRPTSLAVTDTHVYWGTLNGGVLYCEKAGGPPSILSGYLGNQTSLVILAPGTVYWAEPAAVYSTPAL